MMNEIYNRMQDDTEYCSNSENEDSQVLKFYADKTILLTGCTGYIGKCVVEKILRTCTNVKRIYALIRPKKGQTVQERTEKFLRNVIFDKVRATNPDALKKVVPIKCDLIEPDLGISPEDRRLLIENTDVIIHNAAIVLFFPRPTDSLKINVVATEKILELAGECTRLQVFLYISTAYSHSYMKVIEEKFYEPPADMKMVHDVIKADTENETGLSEEALKDMLGKFQNVYVFTKAIAENLVEEYAKTAKFPCAVFRPSIVSSTYKEPIVSWCGNANGPILLFLGVALGIIHVIHMRDDAFSDFLPADMTANAILVILWDLSANKKVGEPYMYNYGTSDVNRYSCVTMRDTLTKYSIDMPSMKIFWDRFVISTDNYWLFSALHILFHSTPVYLLDLFNLIRLRKMRFLPMYRKYKKYFVVLDQFLNGNWVIKIEGVRQIWERMNNADHRLFNCDLRTIDWEEYCSTYWPGIRTYLLKDPMDTIPAARKKARTLHVLHLTVTTIFALIFIYFVYLIYRIVGF